MQELIIGIDPGTATTGFGVLDVTSGLPRLIEYGCISTPKNLQMPDRLLMLAMGLDNLFGKYMPQAVVIENLFFGVNAKTAITVGQGRGVVLVTAAKYGLPCFEYQGLSIKKEITGSGKADKIMIQDSVAKILNVKAWEKPVQGYLDDAVDALAIGLFHYRQINPNDEGLEVKKEKKPKKKK